MTDDSAPSQIGRYRILRPLGQGAMASVYLAELATLGGFRRKVALKVVRDEFARDQKFGQLMAREAMIGSLLQHPNIVETLEFNEADGRMFLALEFVEGQTVEELIKQAKSEGRPSLSIKHSLEIIVQVLQGLSYSHTLENDEGEMVGIVHRDLKPGNIMVSRHGQVKVMDFGIAKAKVAMATITAAGQVRGTPIYMAPEQVTGQALDGRADQFAAATVLYEMLTGKQVFIARNLIEIMRAVSRAQVSEPLRTMSDLHPGLPKIMGRMWARGRDERYDDCKDAANDLQELLHDEQRKEMTLTPVPADIPGATTTGGTKKPGRKKRRKKKEEPEKRGAMANLAAAFGFGRKKKEEPPPRKKRRKKRPTDSQRRPGPTAEGERPRRRRKEPAPEPVLVMDDTTFGDGTDERNSLKKPAAESPPEESSSRGPAMLGPETSQAPDGGAPEASDDFFGLGDLPDEEETDAPEPSGAEDKREPGAKDTTRDPEATAEPAAVAEPDAQEQAEAASQADEPEADEPDEPEADEPDEADEPEADEPEPEADEADEDDQPTYRDDPPAADEPAEEAASTSELAADDGEQTAEAPAPTASPDTTPDAFAVPTAMGLKARTDLLVQAPKPAPAAPAERAAMSQKIAPTDLPSAPALRAQPELLKTEIGPGDETGPEDLPHAPFLRPRVGGLGEDEAAALHPEADPSNLPTPAALEAAPELSDPIDAPTEEDAADVPDTDDLAPDDLPTAAALKAERLLEEASSAPLSGPTRPMPIIDVRAALAQDELPTARMDSNPALANVANDLKTRPMAVQSNIAELLRQKPPAQLGQKPAAQLGPSSEDAPTAADEPVPAADNLASEEMDPFFFED